LIHLSKRRGTSENREDGTDVSLTSSLSLTSALSASVVLASRLPSTAHVFALVLLSVGLFAGWPVLAKGVRVSLTRCTFQDLISQEAGKTFSLLLTTSMILLAISLFPADPSRRYTPSGPTLIFFLIVGLVNIVGPFMLWYSWTWKTRRGGGWEVAKVRLRKTRPG
jgi:phosphatidylinositol glycan class C protein